MTGLEIVLIIAGFACLCVSYYVAQKRTPEQVEGQTSAVWTEKEEQMIRQRVDEILADRKSEMVDHAEDQMNRLCNDKIMAVDEFSKQILEKIKSNHQEVVFMYNMLNEKKKEITDVMTTVSVRRTEESNENAKTDKQPESKEVSAVDEKTDRREKPVRKEKPIQRETPPTQKPAPTRQAVTEPKTALEMLTSKEVHPAEPEVEKKEKPEKAAAPIGEKRQETSVSGSANLQIQKMHKEGKSVLEISKALNIGQGEVKLVIALYGDRKG